MIKILITVLIVIVLSVYAINIWDLYCLGLYGGSLNKLSLM